MMSLPERALTIKQPWAHFIVNLPPEYRKRVENRSRNLGFFQSFWIHSSQALPADYYKRACKVALSLGIPKPLVPAYDALDRGTILGRVTCTALLAPGGIYRHGTKPPSGPDQATSDWYDDLWGYVLENPITVPSSPAPAPKTSGASPPTSSPNSAPRTTAQA